MEKLDADESGGVDREPGEPCRRQLYWIAKLSSLALTTNAVLVEWPTENVVCGVD